VDLSRDLRAALLELRDSRLMQAFQNGKNNVEDELVFHSPDGVIRDPDNLYPLLSAGAHEGRTTKDQIA
jgi:hypothetical protein